MVLPQGAKAIVFAPYWYLRQFLTRKHVKRFGRTTQDRGPAQDHFSSPYSKYTSGSWTQYCLGSIPEVHTDFRPSFPRRRCVTQIFRKVESNTQFRARLLGEKRFLSLVSLLYLQKESEQNCVFGFCVSEIVVNTSREQRRSETIVFTLCVRTTPAS